MPPRVIVFVVVVFWLAMTGVLVEREIVPRWRSGNAPSYTIELTDEVGSPQVEWLVYQGSTKIGRGISHIRRLPDRTFEMSQQFRFDALTISALIAEISVKRLDSVYRVTREGSLLGVKLSGQAILSERGGAGIEVSGDLDGEVVDGYFEPTLKARVFGSPIEIPSAGKFALAEHGSILNPMHLMHRLPRLREGQRWNVPLLDPFRMFSMKELFGQRLPAFPAGTKSLDAEVARDEMEWDNDLVDCLRVDYREPGKGVVARTWVRRQDGLVLAQEARQHGYEFVIHRVP